MHGDFTRLTFRPQNHYSGVRLQQGRVQVDADWNEQVDITSHREDITTADVLGACAAPTNAAGFAIGRASLLRDLRGVALADGSTGFAVGGGPTILATGDGGTNWSRQSAPAGLGAVLLAVAATSPSDAVGVGDSAMIAATTDGGGTWAAVNPPEGVAGDLRGIAFGSATVGHAVGDVATILGTTDGGATWTKRPAPPEVSGALRSVAAPSADRAYAVGDDATIVATANGGLVWTKQAGPDGVDATLRAIHFVDDDIGFAVGDDATILLTTDGGATWTQKVAPSGVMGSLRGVHFASAVAGFAVGDDATILATSDGGATWTQQTVPSGVTATLRAVWLVSGAAGVVVGDRGTVLVTTDSGSTWAVASTPEELAIGPGRMYVDGIPCENEEAAPLDAQPDPPGGVLPDPPNSGEAGKTYLFYLDVWQRHLSAVEDPSMREVALGGPDTASRTKTVWQVRWQEATGLSCDDYGPGWSPAGSAGTGRLAARATPAPPAPDECLVPPGGGYRRLENQLYRVEVHSVDGGGVPQFKWSRDNGSVVATLESVDLANLVITISGIEKDGVAGFAGTAAAEVTDLDRILAGQAGDFVSLDSVDGPTLTMAAASGLADLGAVPIVRRWDGGLAAGEPGHWLELEDGVEVRFASGDYRVGDYWLIPARTLTADVEWPQEESTPELRPPDGVEHHFCPLALMTVSGGQWQLAADCRPVFPPLTGLAGLYIAGGDGQEALPGDPLPQLLSVWTPLENAWVRFTAESGVVAATQADLPGSPSSTIVVTAGGDHTAACAWRLDPSAQPSQLLVATLQTAAGNSIGVPVTFSANLSVAAQVAYDPGTCAPLQDATHVQSAIERIATLPRLTYVGGDGQEGLPAATLGTSLRVGVVSDCAPVNGATVRFQLEQDEGVLAGVGPQGHVVTGPDPATGSPGVAACQWQLGSSTPVQQVQAFLLDGEGNAVGTPVVFTATLSRATDVAYDPKDCELLEKAKARNVQDAISELCRAMGMRPTSSLRLRLAQIVLQNVEDEAGRWQYEGGQVFDTDGSHVANYASTKRVVFEATPGQNTAMLTVTIFFLGKAPPESITLQGAHDFGSGGQSGSVSAASLKFLKLVGQPFRKIKDTVQIGEAVEAPMTPIEEIILEPIHAAPGEPVRLVVVLAAPTEGPVTIRLASSVEVPGLPQEVTVEPGADRAELELRAPPADVVPPEGMRIVVTGRHEARLRRRTLIVEHSA